MSKIATYSNTFSKIYIEFNIFLGHEPYITEPPLKR